MRVVCILTGGDGTVLSSLADHCWRWTPQIAVGQEALFLGIGKCESLYSERTILLRLKVLAERWEKRWQVAVADDLPTALALARWLVAKEALPVEALADYFSPFSPTTELASVVKSLHRMGVHYLRDFLALPRKKILSRFGKEAVFALQLVEDAAHLPWPCWEPEERILERVESLQTLDNLDPLFFLMRMVIERVVGRLHGRGEAASRVEMRLLVERHSRVTDPVRSFVLDFPVPQTSADAFLQVLRERCERELGKRPLERALVAVEFEVLERAPGRWMQRDFFQRKEMEREQWESLLLRMQEKLGRDRFWYAEPVAHQRPEKTWKKSLQPPEDLGFPVAARPTRLLRRPERLRRIEHFLLGSDGKRWKVLKEEGPEILNGEWWALNSFRREYFRVIADGGEVLWIFRTPGGEEWLHGFFD